VSKEVIHFLQNSALEYGPHLTHAVSIEKNSRYHLKILKKNLQERPNLSFVIYFNHLAYGDPLFAAHIAAQIQPPHHNRPLFAPASHSHTNAENPTNRKFYIMIQIAQKLGIDITRVIQAYQVNDPDYNYSPDQAQQTYRDFMTKINEQIKKHQPVGIIISPEGHRSETRSLGNVETGFAKISRMIAPVIYIPVGINYPNNYLRDSINLTKKVQLSIGPTLIHEKTDPEPSINTLMTNLTKALPSNMHGQWGT
jgi:1-acyl-sn-glycerol-3-phosphate acyltransferase